MSCVLPGVHSKLRSQQVKRKCSKYIFVHYCSSDFLQLIYAADISYGIKLCVLKPNGTSLNWRGGLGTVYFKGVTTAVLWSR